MMSSNAWTKIKHTFNTLNVIVGKKKQPMYFFSKKTRKGLSTSPKNFAIFYKTPMKIKEI